MFGGRKLRPVCIITGSILVESVGAFLGSPYPGFSSRYLTSQPGRLCNMAKARKRTSPAEDAPSLRTIKERQGDLDEKIPRLIVMDLDFTLWHPELFQMSGSPYTKSKDGKVRDRSGTVIDLFPDVRSILLAVHGEERFGNTRLAIASRTEHSTWAREVMNLLELEPGLLMHEVFWLEEIYRGSKVKHFGQLRKDSGIPYEDMMFFDDWDQNCKEVGRLGVTCIECPRGLNRTVWRRGLGAFAAAKRSSTR